MKNPDKSKIDMRNIYSKIIRTSWHNSGDPECGQAKQVGDITVCQSETVGCLLGDSPLRSKLNAARSLQLSCPDFYKCISVLSRPIWNGTCPIHQPYIPRLPWRHVAAWWMATRAPWWDLDEIRISWYPILVRILNTTGRTMGPIQ